MCNFLKGDRSRMVNVKVLKSLLKMAFGQGFSGIDTCDKKFSVIDVSRTVGIDDSHKKLDSLLGNIFFGFKGFEKFSRLNDAIIVFVEFFKSLEEEFFLITGENLGNNVSVHNGLEFVLKLS